MQQDILAFFDNAATAQEPIAKEEKEKDNRRQTLEALDKLRALKL